MKILMLHSRYRQRGGEDISTLAESELLEQGGHTVNLVQYDNAEIEKLTGPSAALKTLWSREAVAGVRKILSKDRYDIVQVQNYFPMLSPAVLIAASQMGVATVQALRNYRLTCVNGIMFRDGSDCQQCVGSAIPWSGIKYGCYRDSRAQSSVIAAMIGLHKAIGTWSRHTDAFVSTSEAVRRVYIRAGFPPERIYTKPNIAATSSLDLERKDEAVYVGRLTAEKGVHELISAWITEPFSAKLIIIGSGPDELRLKAMAHGNSSIVFAGELDHISVIQAMAQARIVVIPSLWEEPFGRIATEAFSVGTPVIATNKGGLTDIVGKSGGGGIYEPGDIAALAALIQRAFNDKDWWATTASLARESFRDVYSPSAILRRTETIFELAIKRRKAASR